MNKIKAWGMVLLVALISFMIGALPVILHKAGHR